MVKPRSYTLLAPVFQEVTMGQPMSCEDFQSMGDQYRFQQDFIAALMAQ